LVDLRSEAAAVLATHATHLSHSSKVTRTSTSTSISVRTSSNSDEDITSIHTMNGPITRSRARQLNLQVRFTLVNCVSELTHGAMDVLMIRNFGEDQQGLGKGLGVEEEQQGRHNRKEIKSDSAATPSWVLGPVCTKMDAQDASGLRLQQT
jgi:hypothetical protein